MFFGLASYIECTASAIEALASFRTLYPAHRAKEIELCVKKAAAFIEENQEPEGSWSVLQLLNGLWMPTLLELLDQFMHNFLDEKDFSIPSC